MPIDTPAWVRDAVFYQVFPDRLARSGRVSMVGPLEPWDAPPTTHGIQGGDLLGVVDQLDRLADLGITALYLTPVFTSASNHRYHTDDYLAVDPLLGGDEALRALIDAVHARGMRIVLDGVFNHVGRGFWPFHHVVENGADSPYVDWFHVSEGVRDGRRGLIPYPDGDELEAMDLLDAAGRPSGSRSREVLGYEAWWDLPALPKLNVGNPHARAMLLDVAERWLRFGIDGWRLDVAEEIDEDFWRDFRTRVRSVRDDAYIVAEIWHPAPEWLTGAHFDALMGYPLGMAIIGFAAGRHLDLGIAAGQIEYRAQLRTLDGPGFAARLAQLLALYPSEVNAAMLTMLGSHDTPRLRTVCGGGVDSVRLAMLLALTLPGAPCIYYGDEIGMEGRADPDCRRAFPLDPSGHEPELQAWVREAIGLRHSSTAFRADGVRVLAAEGEALAYLRQDGTDAFVVAVNAGEGATRLTLTLPAGLTAAAPALMGAATARLPAPTVADTDTGPTLTFELAGRDATVLRLSSG